MYYLLLMPILRTSAYTDTDLYEDPSFYINGNYSGDFLGSSCNKTCTSSLSHVYCNHATMKCECEKKYPVKIGPEIGCAKPVNLGDQCFYIQTCEYNDENAACVQINHNAICQCKHGFHMVTLERPTKRVFCSADRLIISSDLSSLLGVALGLTIFTGLICFVLKLFVGSRPRGYANANVSHPLLFHSQPVSVLRGGFTGRGSQMLMPSSRAGAARAAAILLISCHLSPSHVMTGSDYIGGVKCSSTASVHSSSSSIRSFSARQFERERENRLAARARRRHEARSPSPRSGDHLINNESQGEDNEFVTSTPDELEEAKFVDDSSSDSQGEDFELKPVIPLEEHQPKEKNETCFTINQ